MHTFLQRCCAWSCRGTSASASPQNSLKGEICLCSSGGWYRTTTFARGKNFTCNFLQPFWPKSFPFYISVLSCLPEEDFKWVLCVFLLCQPWQVWKWKIMKNHEKFLHFITKWCFFSFYIVDGIWNWADMRANNSRFSLSANSCLSCQPAPTNPTAHTELSWCQESEGLVRGNV